MSYPEEVQMRVCNCSSHEAKSPLRRVVVEQFSGPYLTAMPPDGEQSVRPMAEIATYHCDKCGYEGASYLESVV